MAADAGSSFQEIYRALGTLSGRPVLVQMRSSADGDELSVRGRLRDLRLLGHAAVTVAVGEQGTAMLRLDSLVGGRGRVAEDGGVILRFASGAIFSCQPVGK